MNMQYLSGEAACVEGVRSTLPQFLKPGCYLDGRYQIESFISAGETCEVYKAMHVILGKPVAIKMLRPNGALDDLALERFRREAMALAALKHENIVQIYGNGQMEARFQSRPYLALEYIDGRNLNELLQDAHGNRLSVAEAIPLFLQILDALEHGHERGIVHRNLHPSNIMIKSGAGVKLIDFGKVKMQSHAGCPSRGTGRDREEKAIGCVAMEQCSDCRRDSLAEIYALGRLMFQVIAGRAADETEDQTISANRDLRAARVDADLSAVVAWAMSISSGDRPQSMNALREALRAPGHARRWLAATHRLA